MEKTNVMRILDQKKIKHNEFEYPHKDTPINGEEVALLLNQDPNKVFKTLVTKGKSFYVFMVPVNKNLDLKKACKAVGEKSLTLLPVKDLLATTGYVRGGCSPIGMKKNFRTVCDIQALHFDTIIFSAGKIGYQVEMNPHDLESVCRVEFYDIKE